MIAAVFDSIPAMIVLTGVLVGLSGALLGSFLVLRGSAMLTDAISHSIVLGIILVWLATSQLSGPVQVVGAGLAGLATVILSEVLGRSRLVRMDAAIGLVFPAMFALGVLLISLYARDVHIDVETVLLGEIGFVWLHTVPLWGAEVPVTVLTLSAMLAINLAFVLALWKELKLSIFDPGLAAALGLAPVAVGYGLLALTSATAVAAFDAVGAVLFIAFVIVPPATAFLLTRRLAVMVVLAAAVAVVSVLSGYQLARLWDVSIAGMMATMTGVFFAAALVAAPADGLLAQALRRRTQRLDADCAALVAHLATHAGTPAMAEESTMRALVDHLRWPDARARAVVLRGLDRGLIRRDGSGLVLSPKGDAMARALLAG
ncbi:metal ABC transporter permease [Rhodobaculum claviforme]|uniref:Zinc ABC transporter permease n=1 Tax=Rhodobaculum claviforme TaxID=1549854 RepID=A0A934TKR2_9RHOB|nr:metal ABC transporter permease [Rhodobaculum claviforme]MBK5927321.1 zinc ABC transporter permease [Rhodobaculum claviforme]